MIRLISSLLCALVCSQVFAKGPVIPPEVQRARDDTRRSILQAELTDESSKLTALAREFAYAQQAGLPQGQLQKIMDNQSRTRSNVEALKREISMVDDGPAPVERKATALVIAEKPVPQDSAPVAAVPQSTPNPAWWDTYNRVRKSIK